MLERLTGTGWQLIKAGKKAVQVLGADNGSKRKRRAKGAEGRAGAHRSQRISDSGADGSVRGSESLG